MCLKRVGLLAGAITILLQVPALAQWREGGEVVPDSDESRSVDGFGAMLLITDDPDAFFEAWNRPPSPDYKPKIETTDKARRGDTVVGVVIFSGCMPNADGNCTSSVEFKVFRPDGSVYADLEKSELWTDKPVLPPNTLQVGVTTLGFIVEPDDPFGVYRVEAKVLDEVLGKGVTLVQTIEVVEE